MPLLEGASLFGLTLALLLPWLVGTLGVMSLVGPRLGWIGGLGHGFFVGQILVMVLLMAWDALFGQVAFALPAVFLAGVALVAGAFLLRREKRTLMLPRLSWAAWLAVAFLLALILARFLLMGQELVLRPAYSWDAWMNWVPKAVVWFHHGTLTSFVMPPEWLAAPVGTEVYSLGNWRAAGYPPGVPLVLLWMMLGAGTADHTLIYLPWLVAPFTFALVLWRHLRDLRLGPVLVLVVVYAFLSQPFANIHTMMGGYADVWLALYFALGMIAVGQWRREGGTGYLLLALLAAAGCALMKTPGIVFGALVLLGAVAVAFRIPARWLGTGVLIGVAGIVILLLGGLVPGLGGNGSVRWVLPLPGFLPELHIQPQPLLPILFDSLFLSSNWHLLWLALSLAGLAALRVRGRVVLDSMAVLGLVAATGLLVFVFGFTHYFSQAESLVTLNRAFLYLVPLAMYVMGAWLAETLQSGSGANDRDDTDHPGKRKVQGAN